MSRSDPFARLRRAALAGLVLAGAACGMAEDEQEDRDRRIYLTFSDDAFTEFCLARFDTNGDGRLSRYEARRVLAMDCSDCGIVSLDDLGEFDRLERLDCSHNRLRYLDASRCPHLEQLDCGGNELATLDLSGLRSLRMLRCEENRLERIDLQANVSLATLDARGNRLGTLDLSPCATSLKADVRDNADLKQVYYRVGQQVAADASVELVER